MPKLDLHALCWPALARPGQHSETPGPALRWVASVCTLLWGKSPCGRASLRLRKPYHCETPCRIEFPHSPGFRGRWTAS
jgi:hypothetical protein